MSDITIDAPRNARALVVLIHGHEADKDWGFLPWLSEYLCNAGFAVARFASYGKFNRGSAAFLISSSATHSAARSRSLSRPISTPLA